MLKDKCIKNINEDIIKLIEQFKNNPTKMLEIKYNQ